MALSALPALAAAAPSASAAASARPNNLRREIPDAMLVLRQHDDHVVVGEAVLLGFLRVHVDTVSVVLVVRVLHEPVADRGLAALRRRLEHGVEIHRAAEPDVVAH